MESNQQSIEEMYARMEKDEWDTTSVLKWGFFFSETEKKLKDIYSELTDHNYQVESLHQTEGGEWGMQVTKVEVLASDRLFHRCAAFNELAEAYDSYFDGWDVGQIVSNPALNLDRPTASLLGSLRAARSGGRLVPRYHPVRMERYVFH